MVVFSARVGSGRGTDHRARCRYGWSANMQRIMAAQALGDGQMQAVLAGLKTLEINPRHPLIVRLLQQVEADSEDPAAAETATLLFETALLESGYPVSNQQQFADKVRAMVTVG